MKKYERYIKKYLKERDWHKLKPVDVAKSISIEAAELLEIFQWENLSLEEIKNKKEKIEQTKKELADVLNYCFTLSVLLDLDTEKIMRKKLEKVKEKYPPHIFKNNKNQNPGTEKEYLYIKEKYRKEKK